MPEAGRRGHVVGLVKVVAAVAPELDAGQRENLPATLEQGPPRKRGPKGDRPAPPPASQ